MLFGKNETKPDLELFTVFDSKTQSYSEPFPEVNKDAVLRDFVNAFKRPDASQNNKYFLNAEDFSLFRLGSFSKQTGLIQAHNLEHVANLHDLKAVATPSPGIVPT